MVTLFYKRENEGVRVSYDFSKFIFKNVKTIKEGYWLIGGPIMGNLPYDTEKYSKETDSGSTCVHWHGNKMIAIGLKIRSHRQK